MRAEEFAKATEQDLRRKANECFEELDISGKHEKPALFIEAQFYMDEIERRKQDKVANRDLFLEIVVIVLIALELYFGITGGSQQLAALQKLQTSTSDTATVLKALADEQKAARSTQADTLRTMNEANAAIQSQLKAILDQQKKLQGRQHKPN
jgi:hypothetical protein